MEIRTFQVRADIHIKNASKNVLSSGNTLAFRGINIYFHKYSDVHLTAGKR